jgi:hypothetical protein
LFPDVYVPSNAVVDPVLLAQAAYLSVRDRGGVMAGYTAALLLGADCAPPNAPADAWVPGSMRAPPGLRIRRGRIPEQEVCIARGCRVTDPGRTSWDLTRELGLTEAVVALDALARVGRFSPTTLLERRERERGARGCQGLSAIVALADPRAESPPETRLRVALVSSGLPAPRVQHRVVDEHGCALARCGLAYPDALLAIEYDGADHHTQARIDQDRERDAELARHGWLTHRVGRAGMGYGLPRTVSVIKKLLDLRQPTRYGPIELDRIALVRVIEELAG